MPARRRRKNTSLTEYDVINYFKAILLLPPAMANNTSQHILSTSANLLGFCLFVITSLHITNKSTSSVIDEFTSLIALVLTISCLLSFISIRTKNETRGEELRIYCRLFIYCFTDRNCTDYSTSCIQSHQLIHFPFASETRI
jgi:hypothetical protein